ncbi:hypothetical protein D9M71_168340 [compost metagenome]
MLQQFVDGLQGGLLAVLGNDRQQSPLADAQRRGAGMQVADGHFRQTHVGGDHIDQCLVDPATVVDSYSGELQPFLVDLAGVGAEAARVLATDLGPVRLVRRPGNQPALMEYRHDHRYVGKVGPASAIGIVGDEHVTRQDILGREFLQHAAHRPIEGADEAGNAVALGDQLAAAVGQADAVVQRLIDDRAHAGALEGDEHFLADGHQGVLDDFVSERIGVGHAHASCTWIWM